MSVNEKIPCSVGILTLNSERTLPRALESVKDFAEVIICDGNSTDRTLEIAKKSGAKIIKQYETNEPNVEIKSFAEVRNKCLKESSCDWFLYIDSDEAISQEAVGEIKTIAERSEPPWIYKLPNRIFYNGRLIKHAPSYPGYQTRFFNKKSGAYFVKNVHERLEYDPKNEVGVLKNSWFVFIDEELEDFWKDAKFYVAKEVERAKNQTSRQFFYWTLIKQPLKIFKFMGRSFFFYLRHGFKDSLPVKFQFQKVAYWSYLFFSLVQSRLMNFFSLKRP